MSDSDTPKSAAGRLFDLRTIIGGMFVVYGVVLMVVGIFDDAAEVQKAAGIRINLWLGIGMFVMGALFLFWAWLRPLHVGADPAAAQGDQDTPPH